MIITNRVERSLRDIDWSIKDFVMFLVGHRSESKHLVKLCSLVYDFSVYKAYLDRRRRAVLFLNHKGLIIPVYVGDKGDVFARSITVKAVRKLAEKWYDDLLNDMEMGKFRIRHY